MFKTQILVQFENIYGKSSQVMDLKHSTRLGPYKNYLAIVDSQLNVITVRDLKKNVTIFNGTLDQLLTKKELNIVSHEGKSSRNCEKLTFFRKNEIQKPIQKNFSEVLLPPTDNQWRWSHKGNRDVYDQDLRQSLKQSLLSLSIVSLCFISGSFILDRFTDKKEELPKELLQAVVQKKKLQKTNQTKALAMGSKSVVNKTEQKESGATGQKNAAKGPKGPTLTQMMKSEQIQSLTAKLMGSSLTRQLAAPMNPGVGKKLFTGTQVAAAAVAGSSEGSALAAKNSAAVAGIGGAGVAGEAGYGAVASRGLAGQGDSFVNLDAAQSEVDEGLTKEEVGAVIHKHMNEIRYCYESAMVRNSRVEGKVILAFTIAPQGGVSVVEVKSSSANDPQLDDCILRRLRGWQFPKPRGGVDVAVSYPFLFKTLGT